MSPADQWGDLPLRDDLRALTAYGAPQLDVAVRLNTNENPYPPPPALVDDLRDSVAGAAGSMNRYPDRDAIELRAALAGYLGHGLALDQVWAANGSNEVLQQLLQAFGGAGRTALGFVPSYSMHQLIALATGTGWIGSQRAGDFTLDPGYAVAEIEKHTPSIVFLCSPNNPTGTAMDPAVVEAVLGVAPGMVVVDEAYAEFSHQPSLLPLLADHPRLVITRTMSKAFGFAGARLGYLAASARVVEALMLVRLPYHLSVLTQAAALAALRHADETLAQVATLRADRDSLVTSLRARGYDVVDSDANFVLFGGLADEKAVWQGLLDHGILIRDVGLPGWLRVSVGTTQECEAFLDALDRVVASGTR
ncbi:MAG TPA: histidinol-phosphate transaminase [Mycobacteriales bacterium]|jgi:histidinol-phosphate aminotransferase|nr:histidinol-phosphate transaminase [Mycobacteriales bacterium]HVX69746.1 histidinol-phosphate transaminase [Mycobacteriales bacterium]